MLSTLTYKGHRLIIRHEGLDWIVTIVGPIVDVIRRSSRSVVLRDAMARIDSMVLRPRIDDRPRTRPQVR